MTGGFRANHSVDLSIVIPMFNEADNAETTLGRVKEALAPFQGTFELIAVDDGSTDDTRTLLERLSEKDIPLKLFHIRKTKAEERR